MEGPEEGKKEQGGIRRSRSRKYNPAQSRSLGQENVRVQGVQLPGAALWPISQDPKQWGGGQMAS